jgi:tetratricopeptide (TPR) repeat protein
VQLDEASSRRPTGWIISPLADLTLLVATPLAIVPAVGFAARHFTATAIFLAVTSFASIGHHLPGFLRAYGDPELFRRFRWRFLLAPPLVLAVVLVFTFQKVHGLDLILWLWATWHVIMQTYGLMRIYDLKRGVRDATSARFDFSVCVAVFVAGILFSQTRMFSLLETADSVGLPLGPPSTIAFLRWGLGVALGLVMLGYAIHAMIQAERQGTSWPKIALLLMSGWLYWICGSVSTNLLIGVAMFEIFHAAQYDALVWSYNRRRVDRATDRFGLLRFMFGNGWLSLTVYLLAIAAFGSIKWVAESIDPSISQTLLLTLLFTSTALHFYFDGFIWKVSERGTQQNLGIESSGRRISSVPALIHAAKWSGVAAAALLLFWIETTRTPRTAAEEQAWLANVSQWTPDVPNVLIESGRMALTQHNPTSAVDAARRAVRLRPVSAEAQLLLAQSLLANRDFSAARDAAERAVALDPRSAEACYQLGLANVQLREFPAAEQALQRSIAMNPNSAEAHFQLGNVYCSSNRLDLAEGNYRKAIELSPKFADAYGNLGEVLRERGRVAEAKQALQTALDIGDNPQSHYNLGLILLNEGDASQARVHLQRAENRGQIITSEIRQAAGL